MHLFLNKQTCLQTRGSGHGGTIQPLNPMCLWYCEMKVFSWPYNPLKLKKSNDMASITNIENSYSQILTAD